MNIHEVPLGSIGYIHSKDLKGELEDCLVKLVVDGSRKKIEVLEGEFEGRLFNYESNLEFTQGRNRNGANKVPSISKGANT